MARLIENGPLWELYQYIIKELAQNGAIDLYDHPKFIHRNKQGKNENRLSAPTATLALPSTHAARVRHGLTVDEGGGKFQGAVLRIGMGQYVWDKDMQIVGRRHDTLVTDDPIIEKYNGMWNIRKPRTQPMHEVAKDTTIKAPDPVEEAVKEDLTAMQSKVDEMIDKAADIAMGMAPRTLEVVAHDEQTGRMVLKNGTKVYIVTVVEEVGT